MAILIDRHPISAALKTSLGNAQIGRQRTRSVRCDHVEYRKGHGCNGCGKAHHALTVDHGYLRGQLPAVRRVDACICSALGHGCSCKIGTRDCNRIVYNYGLSRSICVKRSRNRADRGGQLVSKHVLRDDVIVIAEAVRVQDRRAGQVVVELVPQEQLPCKINAFLGISSLSQPLGNRGCALCRVCQQLAFSVPTLVDRMRGQRAKAVRNMQISRVNGQFFDLLGRQIKEDLIRAARNDLKVLIRAVLLNGIVKIARRFIGRCSAVVARAIVQHARGYTRILCVMVDLLTVFGTVVDRTQLGILFKFQCIVVADKRADDAVAVRANPSAKIHTNGILIGHGSGYAAVLVDDGRTHAPLQLLGGKAHKPHVCGDRGQRPAEAKAVGQENVRALFAELLLKKAIAKQDLAHVCLRRGHVGIRCIPLAARYVPFSLGYVLLESFVKLGIIFLCQRIAERPLKIHAIMGVFFKQRKVIRQGVFYTVADRILDRPVPLGVKVCVGYSIKLFVLFHGCPLQSIQN